MKIKSPLVHKDEVEALCEAGATELFCGIETHSWRRQFKDLLISQRPTSVNFSKLTDLEKAIKIAHRHKTEVHVAMNAFFYLEKQYSMAQEILADVVSAGADGVILSDPGFLKLVDKKLLKNLNVIAGCDAVIFNSASVNFYQKLGATRIVVPRSMTVEEISSLVKRETSLEYEVFVINDLCFFEDGLCTFCKEGAGEVKEGDCARGKVHFFSSSRIPPREIAPCRSLFSRKRIADGCSQKGKVDKKFRFWDKKHIDGCGACMLYDFKRIGIDSLKVLDRNLSLEERVRSVSFIKRSLEILEGGPISRGDYVRRCQGLFKQVFNLECDPYDCYYPLWKKPCI